MYQVIVTYWDPLLEEYDEKEYEWDTLAEALKQYEDVCSRLTWSLRSVQLLVDGKTMCQSKWQGPPERRAKECLSNTQ